jgi:hypothetical protein
MSFSSRSSSLSSLTRSNQKFPKGSGAPTSIPKHSQSLTVPQSDSLISMDICLSIAAVFRLWGSELLMLDWFPLGSYFLPVNCRPGLIGQDAKNESRNFREPRIFHDTAIGGSKAPAEQSILWGYRKNLCPCSILEAWISGRPELRPLVSDLYPFTVLSNLSVSCWTTKFCSVNFQFFSSPEPPLEVLLGDLSY